MMPDSYSKKLHIAPMWPGLCCFVGENLLSFVAACGTQGWGKQDEMVTDVCGNNLWGKKYGLSICWLIIVNFI